jgi:hypothetical protein
VKQLQSKGVIDLGWKNKFELLNKSQLQALGIICRASGQEKASLYPFPTARPQSQLLYAKATTDEAANHICTVLGMMVPKLGHERDAISKC